MVDAFEKDDGAEGALSIVAERNGEVVGWLSASLLQPAVGAAYERRSIVFTKDL